MGMSAKEKTAAEDGLDDKAFARLRPAARVVEAMRSSAAFYRSFAAARRVAESDSGKSIHPDSRKKIDRFEKAQERLLALSAEDWAAWEADPQREQAIIEAFSHANGDGWGALGSRAGEWIEDFGETPAGALALEKLRARNAKQLGHFFFLADVWFERANREAEGGLGRRKPASPGWLPAIAWLRQGVDAQTWAEGLSGRWAKIGATRAARAIAAQPGAWTERRAQESWGALRALKDGGADFWSPGHAWHEKPVWVSLAKNAPALIGWLDGAQETNKRVEKGGDMAGSLVEVGLRHPAQAKSFLWFPPEEWAGRPQWMRAVSEAPTVKDGALSGLKMEAWRTALGARLPSEWPESDAGGHPYAHLAIEASHNPDGSLSSEERLERGAAIRCWIEWGGARREGDKSDLTLARALSAEDARALSEKGLLDYSRDHDPRARADAPSPLRALYAQAKASGWQATRRAARDPDPTALPAEIETAIHAIAAAGGRDNQPDEEGNLLIHQAIGDRSLGFALALASSGAPDLAALNRHGRGVAEMAVSSLGSHKDERARMLLATLAQRAFEQLPRLPEASEKRLVAWMEKNRSKMEGFPQLIAAGEKLALERVSREARESAAKAPGAEAALPAQPASRPGRRL